VKITGGKLKGGLSMIGGWYVPPGQDGLRTPKKIYRRLSSKSREFLLPFR
jgi:hypothetical protein